MASSTFLHGITPTRVSLRRNPVQDFRQLLVHIYLLNVEHHWPTLLHIYQRLHQTGGLRSLYWDRNPDDLISFPEFLSKHSPQADSVMFSIEHLTPSKERIFAGIFTLVGFVERHRAIIGIWIEPKYRGVNSHLIAKQVINYCHKTVKLENIYALTPWRHAAEHARRTGMVEVAELPNYCKFGGRVMDVTVLHSDQQLWRYQVRADLEAIGYAPETAEQLMRDYVGDEKLDLGKLMDLRAQILNKTELDNEHQQPV